MDQPDIAHEILGNLQFDGEHRWYKGRADVRGTPTEFTLSHEGDGDLAPLLARAAAVIGQVEHFADAAKAYAVEELLELKNDEWLDEDEEPLTSEDFQGAMQLESISFEPDGEVLFFHDDGDLFWGHCILITMDREDRFTHADIAG